MVMQTFRSDFEIESVRMKGVYVLQPFLSALSLFSSLCLERLVTMFD